MNEKSYKKRLDFQQNMITRQSKQVEDLKLQNEKLKLELQEKDKIINSVGQLRDELTEHVAESKKYKEEFRELVQELRKMKKIMNKEVYNNRWWLIKFLIK